MEDLQRRKQEIEMAQDAKNRGLSVLVAFSFFEFERQVREKYQIEQIKKYSLPAHMLQNRNSNYGVGK